MNIKQSTEETYNRIAIEYNKDQHTDYWQAEFEYFKRNIKGKRIIDLGCGPGRQGIVFIENGFDYTGIDVSEEMLSIANQQAPQGSYFKKDFQKTGFKNDSFDGFWAAASFFHIPKKDISIVLKEASRITKVDGLGLILIKEKTNIDEDFIQEDKFGGINRYFSFYAEDEFRRILEENNFLVIKIIRKANIKQHKSDWLGYFVVNQKS